MTLMVNRSDRRFQTLSPTRAREAARLIENEARGNPSRPGASSDARQAGRIYDCNRVPHRVCTFTLARGEVHTCLAERDGFEPSYMDPAPVASRSID